MKEDDKIMASKEGEVKKRLEDLVVKLNSLDVNLKDYGLNLKGLETIWDSWNSFRDQQTRGKKRFNFIKLRKFLISFPVDLENEWLRLFPSPDDWIPDKVDINFFHNFLRKWILDCIHFLEKDFTLRKIFKVNDFLTLRLENGISNIYINGKLFIQCKFLLLNIPTDNIENSMELNQ